MRHINYVLKPATIDNAKPKAKRYDLTDGGGLVLEVMPSGSKTWRVKYHLNGKREKVTIGAYPAFTIKQARDRHDELRALVERGQSLAKSKQTTLAGTRFTSAPSGCAQRSGPDCMRFRLSSVTCPPIAMPRSLGTRSATGRPRSSWPGSSVRRSTRATRTRPSPGSSA